MARRASGSFSRLVSKSESLRPAVVAATLLRKPAACNAARAFGIADQTAALTVSLGSGHHEFYGRGGGCGRSSSSSVGRAAALMFGVTGAVSCLKTKRDGAAARCEAASPATAAAGLPPRAPRPPRSPAMDIDGESSRSKGECSGTGQDSREDDTCQGQILASSASHELVVAADAVAVEPSSSLPSPVVVGDSDGAGKNVAPFDPLEGAIDELHHNSAVESANSASFRALASMEMRDELQKVHLARLLQELHALATESSPNSDDGDSSLSPGSELDSSKEDGGDGKEMLRFDPEKPLTPAETALQIKALRQGKRFDRTSINSLLTTSSQTLLREPTLIDLRGKAKNVTVVGDLHGSIECLADVLEIVAQDIEDRNAAVIFNGDFVDRGENSLEVILTLLLLKLTHPDRVYLCRGNHEDSFLSAVYGFEDELKAKYGDKDFDALWGMLSNVFSALPVCVRTDTAAVMHGGIPHENFDLAEVEKVTVEQRCCVKSTLEPMNEVDQLLQGILWSDPNPNVTGVIPNDARGCGMVYGPDVARDFLRRHDLRYVIRSHEVVESGWEAMDCGDGRYVLTVFSTAAYPNREGFNKGAVLRLGADGAVEPVQFARSNQLPNGHLAEQALNSLIDMIIENKAALAEALEAAAEAEAHSGPGMVSKEKWADVMADAMSLPDLDWVALQPSLAPTTCVDTDCEHNHHRDTPAQRSKQLLDTGLINWQRFLDLHSIGISSDGEEDGMDDGAIATLYANHAMLLTVFKFLDTDGNGRVDPEEFRAGVELLNARLPKERQLGDPDKLFKILDLDGNGEIELDEFSEVFKVM